MENSTGSVAFNDEIPSEAIIRKWIAGIPDEEQLVAIIARSYDYIRKLPLRGITEHYSYDDPATDSAEE